LRRINKIEIELIDDNTIQIKTVDKSDVSNASGIFRNNTFDNDANVGVMQSNPNNMYNNKFWNYISRIESLSANQGQKQDADTVSISKAYKFQFVDEKWENNENLKQDDIEAWNIANDDFKPNFKVYNQLLKPNIKTHQPNDQKSNSSPIFTSNTQPL